MKAVAINYYAVPYQAIIHSDVVEIPKRGWNREFRCLCCGYQWIENINSPQILSEEDFRCYDHLEVEVHKCTDIKI